MVDKPRPSDIYLLCTDGLSNMVPDDDIRELNLQEPDLEAVVYGLIEVANDRGGKDNITVILIKVLEKKPSVRWIPAACKRVGCVEVLTDTALPVMAGYSRQTGRCA